MKKLRLSGFALGVAWDADFAISSRGIAIYAAIRSLRNVQRLQPSFSLGGMSGLIIAFPFTAVLALENVFRDIRRELYFAVHDGLWSF